MKFTRLPSAIPQKLHAIAASIDLAVEYRPIRRSRGWPEKSAKPFGLYFKSGGLIASFATLRQLEDNLRARAGC